MHHSLINFCLTAALGCVLSLILSLLFWRPHPQKQERYPSLTALLPYGRCLSAKVIALKEGALLALYQLQPLDISCKSELELESLRDKLAAAVLQLDEGYTLHVDVLTHEDPRYYPDDHSTLECSNFYAQVLRDSCMHKPALQRQYFVAITRQVTQKKALFQALLTDCQLPEALLAEVKRFEESLGPIENALSLIYQVTA